jgi:hypothetical protein
MSTINVFTIDPATRSIAYGPIPRGLPGLYSALGCGTVDVVPLRPGLDLWIDDEGRLEYPNPRGYFRLAGQVVCGRGVVAGVSDGETISVPFGGLVPMFNALIRAIEWIDTPPAEDVEPGFRIIAMEPS